MDTSRAILTCGFSHLLVFGGGGGFHLKDHGTVESPICKVKKLSKLVQEGGENVEMHMNSDRGDRHRVDSPRWRMGVPHFPNQVPVL